MVSAADRVAGRYRTPTNSGDNALPRAIMTIVNQITKLTVTAATMPLVYNHKRSCLQRRVSLYVGIFGDRSIATSARI